MRFPLSSTLTVAAFALAPILMIAVTAPAHAQGSSGDYRCTALADQARAAATLPGLSAGDATSARRAVSTGVTLCNARAEGAAARQFRRALAIANVTEARADTNARVASTGAVAGGN
jgi:hypothetical protein